MNFSNKFAVEGRSNGSTMGQAFAEASNGSIYDFLSNEGVFAYQSYIIDPLNNTSDNDQYVPAYLGKDLKQSISVYTSGKINELTFSFGGNYDDKLFVGATIGVPFLSYTEKRSYEEMDDQNVVDHLNSFNINDKLMVSSTGINLKLGILYQPVSFLRFGAAYHTPTYYGNMHDILEREMVSFGDTTLNISYTNDYNYQLITPGRVMANIAFLIMKRGFISADYEYTDYSKSEMGSWGSNSYLFKDENKAIRDSYQSTHTIRVGGEVYLTKNFLFRAGYAYTSSPYQDNINDASLKVGSFGLGYRSNSFFVDVAYQYKTSNQNYWFFNPEMVNPVNQQYVSHYIVGTFGWKL
jgi:long-subunit fatty acid transport protein